MHWIAHTAALGQIRKQKSVTKEFCIVLSRSTVTIFEGFVATKGQERLHGSFLPFGGSDMQCTTTVAVRRTNVDACVCDDLQVLDLTLPRMVAKQLAKLSFFSKEKAAVLPKGGDHHLVSVRHGIAHRGAAPPVFEVDVCFELKKELHYV